MKVKKGSWFYAVVCEPVATECMVTRDPFTFPNSNSSHRCKLHNGKVIISLETYDHYSKISRYKFYLTKETKEKLIGKMETASEHPVPPGLAAKLDTGIKY